jgi:hypothetical protein
MAIERLNPLNDIFLKIMGEKGDEEQLLAFLNAVLKRPDKQLQSIEIIENKAIPAKLRTVSQDEKAIRIYEMREKALADWTSGMNHAKREG